MQVEMSLEEMVEKPLSQDDIASYKQQLARLGKYEQRLFIGFVALLLVVCGVFYGTFLSSGFPAWWAKFTVYVGGFSIFFYFVLFALGRLSLKKYPTSLVIDGKDRLQGTAGMEFEIVAVNTSIMPEGSQAYRFYRNIVRQGRGVLAFEKQLIEEMLGLRG